MSVDRVAEITTSGELANLRSPRAGSVALICRNVCQVGVFLPALIGAVVLACGVSSASAAGTVAWSIRNVAEPTQFSPGDSVRCEKEREFCDRYQLLAMNAGDSDSTGPIVVKDRLPSGLVTAKAPEGIGWSCAGGRGETEVMCEYESPVLGAHVVPPLVVYVTWPDESQNGQYLTNEASITGGGTEVLTTAREQTLVSAKVPAFGLDEFNVEAGTAAADSSIQAGAHPWQLTTSLEIPTVELPEAVPESQGEIIGPVETWKSASVELPMGFIGDVQTRAECTGHELVGEKCPTASIVGSAELGAALEGDGFVYSEEYEVETPLYNLAPEGGYPAEFGFVVSPGDPVYLYASVVRSAGGYRLRVSAPGLPGGGVGAFGTVLTFYGSPAEVAGEPSKGAFLTNPTRCTGEPEKARAEVESWEDLGHPVARETTVYPQLTGCDLLTGEFHPTVAMAPSEAGDAPQQGGTTRADEPSAYSFSLKSPQTEGFDELAAPELKNVAVTLPEGVSVSPSAGDGLVACPATGSEGIDIPTGENGAGEPLHDNEAGEGEEIGADGMSHLAKGHCPLASTLGTVDIFTPVLPTRCGGEGQAACKEPDEAAPLQGHVYLAQPECGGGGQQECSNAYAEGKGGPSGDGHLFGLYIEAEGSGVIIKLAGTVSANPTTGQLTATFKENPQLPFSELQLHLHGGPRAPLANPQTCGSFATASTISSWAEQEASGISPPFNVDWDGNGGACPASLPFAPSATAGTTNPVAGAYSPFTFQIVRQDREQDLGKVEGTLPDGLLAKLAGVPECGEVEANAGTCPSSSRIGSVIATAGSGSEPLAEHGSVYLTGPYNNGPFGISVVVPAAAGPFNLGNVVVRGSIRINPVTAQASFVSNPLPTIVDGVPLRVKALDVTLDREDFTFNPTNCDSQHVTGTITGVQGASAAVSSPFAVTGCAGLKFTPAISVSTSGSASKADGASLTTKLQEPADALGTQANIAYVKVELPKALPSRLSTLQKACTSAQFEANPAGCPATSDVGHAVVRTPLLPVPLEGPAIFVSHGGEAFPSLTLVLQGDGVTIDLVGTTFISKAEITSTTFKAVPDAPFSSFELTLPEGPYSALTTFLPHESRDLCGQKLTMPTEFIAQDGAVIKQSTAIVVTGCSPSITVIGHKVRGRTAAITVSVPAAGKLVATGKGLSKGSGKTGKAGAVTVKLTLTKGEAATLARHKGRKLSARVRLTFTPQKGSKLTTTTTVVVG
jgi:hypothetical protein